MKFRFSSVPYIVWSAIFVVVPLILVAVFGLSTTEGEFTFANVAKVSDYTAVFVRSIWLSLVATAICLVIAYPLGFIMSRYDANNQRLLVMLVMLPMWMNFLLRTYSWMTILENHGLLNQLFEKIGLISLYNHIFGTELEYFSMMNTQGAVVLGMVYNYLPFMVIPLYSIMTKIEPYTLEAAGDLGANPWNTFTRVVLPLSVPGITTGITMVFVPSVSTFIISRMLGGGSNMMVGDLIETQFLGNAYNPNLGSAISLVLMVFILLVMSLMNQFEDNDDRGGMLI